MTAARVGLRKRLKKCSAEVVIVEVVIVIKAFVIESRPKSAAGKHGIYVAFFGSFFFPPPVVY